MTNRRVVKARRGGGGGSARSTPPPDGPSMASEFAKYADAADGDTIGPEGVERLLADLGLDPTDRRVLLLAWKAGAARMGFFTRGELTRAGAALRAPSFPALAAALPGLATATDASPGALADFMGFAFKYCLTEPGQRILDLDTATALLRVALPPSNPHTKPLLEYVSSQSDAKAVTADTWAGIARFVTAVDGKCANHDESDAWPLLLDNYVAWVRAKQAKKGGKPSP